MPQTPNPLLEMTDATMQDIDGLVEVFMEYESQEHALANAMFVAQGLSPLPLQLNKQEITDTLMSQITDLTIKLLVAKEGQIIVEYVCGWITGKGVYDASQDRPQFIIDNKLGSDEYAMLLATSIRVI